MAEEQPHHHHHHHHHVDSATLFKRRQLAAIKRRKILTKWAFRALCVVAVLMAIAVFVVYHIR